MELQLSCITETISLSGDADLVPQHRWLSMTSFAFIREIIARSYRIVYRLDHSKHLIEVIRF